MSDLIRLTAILLVATSCALEANDRLAKLPDIPDYKTLHCDFHMHTVFSDGKVWPDIRVTEAVDENLDCIAITDHLKYNKGSKQPEISSDRNRSADIAIESAKNTSLIVIRGAEITQGMPPGHINAVFLSDSEIAQPDYKDTLENARKQGAFLFWNHPSWKSPDKKWVQDGIAQWFEEHDVLVDNKTIQGIEVVNARSYSREAHLWALEKNLTIFGNTDIHNLAALEYDLTKEHRPTTLVFAKEKSLESIKEALFERRTAIWYGNSLIGKAEFLGPIFKQCVKPGKVKYMENLAITSLKNKCDLDFFIENNGPYSFFNATRFIELKAGTKTDLAIKTGQKKDSFTLSLSVSNLHTTPDEVLQVDLQFVNSGVHVNKSGQPLE